MNNCEAFALIHDGWSRGSKHYLGIYASFVKSNAVKLRLLSVSRMLQQDIVSVESENLSSIFDELDDISSDEEDGCLAVRAITRESTNFKVETINNTIRLVLSGYKWRLRTTKNLFVSLQTRQV